jgi:hypothetical protein
MHNPHSLLNYSKLTKTEYRCSMILVRVMVFNTTFNKVSVISYIVAVSFISGGNRRTRRDPTTCRWHWQTLSHNVIHLALSGSRIHNISGNRHVWYLLLCSNSPCSNKRKLFMYNIAHNPSLNNFWFVDKTNKDKFIMKLSGAVINSYSEY